MAWQPKLRELIANSVIDVLRQSLRRRFPVVKDDAFNELLEGLTNVFAKQGRSTPQDA